MENTLIPFIPSNLAPLLQIDLLVLEQTRKKNAAQHRSGLFFRRVHEIYRLGKEIYRELDYMSTWTAEERERRKAEAFRLQHEIREEGHDKIQQEAAKDAERHICRLKMLLERIFPALSKASDSVTKMIHHLHFLPLTTLLHAAYARIWVISTTIHAHVSPQRAQGSGEMTAVLSAEEVVRFGSIHTDLGRIGIAREELDKRANDLSEVKGKTREEFTDTSPQEQIPEQLGAEDDIFVDFGTKVDRPSPSASLPIEATQNPGPILDRPLPKAAARIRKASPVVPMPFSRPGSGSSTPIGDQTIFSPAFLAEPSDSAGRGTASNGKSEDKKDKGTAVQKKKRTKEIDDLFGGLSGSEKKRKVAKPSPIPPDATPMAEQDASRSEGMTVEVSKASVSAVRHETKRASNQVSDPGTGKVKQKKKKKKGDDLDDIFGF